MAKTNSIPLTDIKTNSLKQQYKELHEMIYKAECYGIYDLRLISEIGKELESRGIEISENSRIVFKQITQ